MVPGLRNDGGNGGSAPDSFWAAPMLGGRNFEAPGVPPTVPPTVPPIVPPTVPPIVPPTVPPTVPPASACCGLGSSFGSFSSLGVSRGWTMSGFGCSTGRGLTVGRFLGVAPPPAGGGGGGGGAADRNVTFSSGGDSSSTCQNEYTMPAVISAAWSATDAAYHKRRR